MPMREAKRLLIVDDDPGVRSLMRAVFETENFEISEAASGRDMSAQLAAQSFDLITLDLGLPDVSGVELARNLCLSTDVPVIVVSGRAEHYDRIIALELGADDYIVKPFNTRELVARVRAVLRRSIANGKRHAPPNPVVASDVMFHGHRLNVQTRRIRLSSGAVIDLTVAECKLLEVLVERAGHACTRDEITSRLKGRNWSPLDRSLDTLVARLRRKIEPDPDQPSPDECARHWIYDDCLKD